ncbi:MAG: 2,3-bisphosphoglycerate-independent phosphoglycerate mutase [Gallionellaceae bacterium]|nr:MAG: 2,3-bisphosphoglycerate-independent phosphoglycerate mutase [Gallionellaceae bacterium]
MALPWLRNDAMKHLHLLIPDLLLPHDAMQRISAGLKLPFLSKILARSDQTNALHRELEDGLCETFGAQAFAPIRAAADGLEVGSAYWMCVDPIHLELQQSQVILQPEVKCGAEESAALCVALNQHFSQDGITFIAPHPQRWYIHSDGGADVQTTPLRVASWRDVKPYQPQGADALRWRSFSNEIQMLLHGHVINQGREARGMQAINSVWLWGGGCANDIKTKVGAIGGDESLSSPFAKVAAIPYCSSLADMLRVECEAGVWVESALATAWQRGDLYAWRDAMEWVERELAQPLWMAIEQGRLQTLTFDVLTETETRRFVFDRAASWKLWRRTSSLPAYVV